MFAPHLPLRGEEVRARLMERWSTPVVLDNDANCAARAEVAVRRRARRGRRGRGHPRHRHRRSGRHRRPGACAGTTAWPASSGTCRSCPTDATCECGRRGCWEQYSSGNALVRYARARLNEQPTKLSDLCGGDPAALTGPMVTSAAQEGDPLALDGFAVVGNWLGVGVANLVAAFDPDVVVIGGGVSAASDLLLEPAREALGRSLVGAGHRSVPPVLKATLGPESGAIGAADMVRTTVKQTGRRAMAVGTRARARSRAARGRARRL